MLHTWRRKAAVLCCLSFQHSSLPHTLLTTRSPPTQEALLRIPRRCSRRCPAQSTHKGSCGCPCEHVVLTLTLPGPSQPLCNTNTGGPVIPIILPEILANRTTGRMCLLLSPHSHNPPSLCPCQAQVMCGGVRWLLYILMSQTLISLNICSQHVRGVSCCFLLWPQHPIPAPPWLIYLQEWHHLWQDNTL